MNTVLTFQVKDELSKLMRKPESHIRILFATEAFSMGADSPNIRKVVHIGPPTTVESEYCNNAR